MKRVWEEQTFEKIRLDGSISRTDQWIVKAFQRDQSLPVRELTGMVLWHIWKARNTWIFQSKEPRLADLLSTAKEQQAFFSRGKTNKSKNSTDLTKPDQWRPPEGDDLKLNVDVAWCSGDFLGSAAGIVRD